MLQIKQEKEEMDRSHKEQLYSNDTTIKEKGISSIICTKWWISHGIGLMLKLH